MATPRRAAAVAAAALSRSSVGSGGSAGQSEEAARPGDKQEKAKVDWGDVEAKAKREAMWLLEWRKQQAAHAESLPTQLPPKKRRRKSCSNDDAPARATDTPAPPATATPRSESPQQQQSEKAADAVVVAGEHAVRVDKPTTPPTSLWPSKSPEIPSSPTAAAATSAPSQHASPSSQVDTVQGTAVRTTTTTEPTAPEPPPAPAATATASPASVASVEVKGTDLLWPATLMEVADVFQVLASQPRLHSGTSGGGCKGKRPAPTVIDPATGASLPHSCTSPAKKRKQQQHQQHQQEQEKGDRAKDDDTASSGTSLPSEVVGGGGGGAELPGQKGMCLLAAAAARRALEEAQRDLEKGKRVPSEGAASSCSNGAANVEPGGSGERPTPLPWRPRELRFIVTAPNNPPSSGARENGGDGDGDAGLSGESATEAWWQQVPRLPGFSASSEITPAIGQEKRTHIGIGGGGGDFRPFGEGSASPASSFGAARTARDGSSASSSSTGGVEDDGEAEAGWNRGRYSLRWLPAEGLAALQAAGAACGMDRAALDAAAAREEEEEARARAAAEAERAAAEADRAAYEAAANGTGPVMWGYDGYYDGGAAAVQQRAVRPRAKRRPRRKRETHVLVSESDDEGNTTTSVWAGLEEAAKAEAKAIMDYRKSGLAEAESEENQHWVRRSVRAAGSSALDCPHVVKLLEQIRADDPEVEVLKLHHYLGPDVNTAVIDAVLEALMVNGNCQALYIQNFNEGFRDEQVAALAKVLRRGNIWCLNAGENYKVKLATWWEFVKEIESTNVTHAYLSEHVITADLKKAMRKAIRDNRVKHTRHKTAANFEVIRRCTNMWWNPINSKDLQAELKVLDGSFPGIAPGVPSPAKHVPCSLHWREEQERKRLQLAAVGRPESPDLTDCAPRGPMVFRREDDD
eukprot:g13688.t1